MNHQSILSRQACNALRGLAIIGIFLHNYCHWLGPIVKENEYQYFQHNVDWLAQVIANADIYLPEDDTRNGICRLSGEHHPAEATAQAVVRCPTAVALLTIPYAQLAGRGKRPTRDFP